MSVCFRCSYAPGDVVMIQPCNPSNTVAEFLQLLGLDPDQQFTLQPNDPGKIVYHLYFIVLVLYI